MKTAELKLCNRYNYMGFTYSKGVKYGVTNDIKAKKLAALVDEYGRHYFHVGSPEGAVVESEVEVVTTPDDTEDTGGTPPIDTDANVDLDTNADDSVVVLGANADSTIDSSTDEGVTI